ncbi:glycoside hydrolase family 88 protein [Flavobacteriaceae bacterium D16]|nr:glycoside hydrolase family 88 protein [Flavobacteriaceae bacterium D16]
MFSSEDLLMPMRQYPNFTSKLKHLKQDDKTSIFYYPRAYLALGLIEYAIESDDTGLFYDTKMIFDDFYFNPKDKMSFELEFVDQVPIGLCALKIYKKTKEIKYKIFAENVFDWLNSKVKCIDGMELVLYRDHHDYLFVDTLGMICPFLVEYGKEFNVERAFSLAIAEFEYFQDYGLDHSVRTPFHAINLEENLALGPNNWGRGMGWYAIALAAMVELEMCCDNSQNKRLYSAEARAFFENIQKLSLNGLFSQFPGTSRKLDSSATTMLMYAGAKFIEPVWYKKAKEELSTLIKTNGKIGFCSGDTVSVNLYSKTFGESELSQGFLLLLLH